MHILSISGAGRSFVFRLIAAARKEQDYAEIALFVYKDNVPAYQCYLAMGFEVQEYPDGAPMPEKCFYLTRPVGRT